MLIIFKKKNIFIIPQKALSGLLEDGIRTVHLPVTGEAEAGGSLRVKASLVHSKVQAC